MKIHGSIIKQYGLFNWNFTSTNENLHTVSPYIDSLSFNVLILPIPLNSIIMNDNLGATNQFHVVNAKSVACILHLVVHLPLLNKWLNVISVLLLTKLFIHALSSVSTVSGKSFFNIFSMIHTTRVKSKNKFVSWTTKVIGRIY